MRIAQVTPFHSLIQAQGSSRLSFGDLDFDGLDFGDFQSYSDVETTVGILANALSNRGHQVTVFAPAGSKTLQNQSAILDSVHELQTPCSRGTDVSTEAVQIQALANQFDLIHFHAIDPPFELTETLAVPTLYTLYGSFSPKTYQRCARYRNHNFISISEHQRQGGPDLNYIRTIYSGVSLEDYPFNAQVTTLPEVTEHSDQPQPVLSLPPEPYLAFLGQMSPEQGPHLAIEVAKRSGLPLKLAGRIEERDRAFFETEIAPHIGGHAVDYWGELDRSSKVRLLGEARATLFPSTSNQPFENLMVESMAVGTPALTTSLGAASEVIVPGKTGFLCDSLDQMVEAVLEAEGLKRQDCRDLVARHFSLQPMVERYEAAYGKVLDDWQIRNRSVHSAAIAL